MIVPMTEEFAQQIATWKYEGEYAFYSHTNNPELVCHLMNGEYYAVLDSNKTLYGYYCFGESSQIPTVEEHVYEAAALDIGLGMRPDRCGKGAGYDFVKSGIEFARDRFGPNAFRLSVAAFNQRAIKVYEKVGFRITQTVTNSYFKNSFYIMMLEQD
jgi:RimJ/RimL family protein N-acetyltransferase